MSRTFLIILACLIVGNVKSFLIGKHDINTKDIPVPVNTDDEFEGDVDEVHKVMGFPRLINENGVIRRKADTTTDASLVNKVEGNEEEVNHAGADTDKKCAAIGEFCMNHSDCCTNACLGYMKRCVS